MDTYGAAWLTLAFVFLSAGETCSALQCYNCGWSATTCKTKSQVDPSEEPLPYPVATKCVGEETHPPNRSVIEKSCARHTCNGKNQACMKWIFLSAGGPVNVTYTCVGNPEDRKRCYTTEISKGDKEKKGTTEATKVEVCLCDKDFCNSSTDMTSFAILVLAMAIFLINNSRLAYCG